MAYWYLVRHGETAWNAEERIQGQTDVPLHGPGRREAALTGRRLADTCFGAVYCSDLSRTQETARIIVDAQSAPGSPEVQPMPVLREIAYGAFEGLTWAEIGARDPGAGERQFSRDLDFAPERGETFRQVIARVGEFARVLKADHADEEGLVVGHGGSLRALLVCLLGLPDEAFWRFRGLRPASISVVRQDGGVPALVGWNDVGHLV